jgi:N-acetylglucosamine-6-phosphate deacetylase
MKICGTVPADGDQVSLEIMDGVIVSRERKEGPGEGLWVSPGFIDIQVNGYRGIDYVSGALDAEQVRELVLLLAASGVTKHFATVTSAEKQRILRSIEVIRSAAEQDAAVGRGVAGIHIEGPFISRESGARGTHDASVLRNPDLEEFSRWQQAAGDLLKVITLAPELPGAIEFIREITAAGVAAAIGHTAASPEIIAEAVSAGAVLSTHLGNGSNLMIPRLKNYLWAQLASDDMYASIITDSHHLGPDVIKVIHRAKGSGRLILVSDVSPFGGYPKGVYTWGNVTVEVFEDGHIGLPGTELLSGAAHLLDWDIVQFMRAAGVSLCEALSLCTDNPRRLFRLSHPEGSLNAGEPADLVIFGYDGKQDSLDIVRTVSGGVTVYSHQGE